MIVTVLELTFSGGQLRGASYTVDTQGRRGALLISLNSVPEPVIEALNRAVKSRGRVQLAFDERRLLLDHILGVELLGRGDVRIKAMVAAPPVR